MRDPFSFIFTRKYESIKSMNLYQTVAIDDADDEHVAWAGSQVGATKDRVAFKKRGLKNPDTLEVEVPTSKAGLLKFLNDSKVVV